MTLRAVVDTNVLVSGLGWRGPPATVVDAALRGSIQLVTSQALLDELLRVPEALGAIVFVLLRASRQSRQHRQWDDLDPVVIRRRPWGHFLAGG